MRYFLIGVYRILLGAMMFFTIPIWGVMLVGGWDGKIIDKLWSIGTDK